MQPSRPMSNPLFAQPARRWSARQILVAVIILAGGGTWLFLAIRRGSLTADPSGVTRIVHSQPVDGERDVLPNAYVVAMLNPGHAIDRGTIDAGTSLYRTSDHQPVMAQVSTSAAGDDLTLTPAAMLEPNTRYTFEVKGVKDMTGGDVLPFTMTFTTGSGAASHSFPVAFEKKELESDHNYYTGLVVGPDRKLYAGTVDGKIVRRAINPDGSLGEPEIITTVQKNNQGARLITGIAFDPKARKDKLILWVSHGQFIINQRGEPSLVGATEWTGKISTVAGPDLAEYRDVVVNLPRSFRDHLNNQPVFGPDDCLYWSQGSHTAMGAPDEKWGHNRVERLLTAAVLRLDPSKVPTDHPLDVKTSDGGGTYDPFGFDVPLTIYASGVRVGFDLLWHSNGALYTGTNGSARGGSTPATPSDGNVPRRIDGKPYDGGQILGLTINEDQPDMLLKLDQGGYYGHPNPLRGEYVLNGGNPTKNRDPFEVTAYPVGTKPDRNWRAPVYSFGISASPNGMIEYKSDGRFFGGMLDNRILVTRFNPSDIMVLSLDKHGAVSETITGIAGLTGFIQPLDLTEDEQTGCIYVAEYRGERLAILRPLTDRRKLADLPQNVFQQQVNPSAE